MTTPPFSALAADPASFRRRALALRRPAGTAVAACMALALAGCASGPPNDPLEPYNRGMATFNENVDDVVLKPVATVYKTITPPMVRTGVSNFFSNVSDIWSFANNVLQLHPEGALNSAVRVTVNTVFGLGGLLDVASEMGVDRRKQDFGLTLGHWGVPTGPYLVLPLLGPSTVRDTVALPLDWKGNPLDGVTPVATRNSLLGLRMLNTRANLLRASEVLDSAALDKYSFTRDVFLSLRSQGRADRQDGGTLDDGAAGLQDGRLPDEPY